MEVANFDSVAAEIMKRGGRVALEKFAVPGVCWQGYFIDPDGNTFGLFQPDPQAKVTAILTSPGVGRRMGRTGEVTMGIRMTAYRLPLALSFVVAVVGSLQTTVRAEIRVAAALTPEAVWDAIDAAKDGDVVRLPAGTAVWKRGWNSGHWAKMKAITIQGAGIDETIIRTDTTTAPGDKAFVINGVEGKPFRITGITFDGTGFANAGTWAGEVVINGNCKNFRVDHCKFLNMDHMITITGDTYGLVDHCKFYALKKNRLAQTIYCQGPGKVAFTRPLTLGTAQAVYFEDNDVRFSPEVVNTDGNNPWIVPYSGARVVIRHNTIVNSQLEIYRVRPGALGCQSAEIYDNTFSAEGLKMGRPRGSSSSPAASPWCSTTP